MNLTLVLGRAGQTGRAGPPQLSAGEPQGACSPKNPLYIRPTVTAVNPCPSACLPVCLSVCLSDPSPSPQLHDKFEQLKRLHQEEKRKVEEKRRDLEEEMNAHNRKKVAAETLALAQPLKKDKDRRK